MATQSQQAQGMVSTTGLNSELQPLQEGEATRISDLQVSDRCRASERDWRVLQGAVRNQAWKLCALSLGLRPMKDIATHLREDGCFDAHAEYTARKEILRVNLTSSPDPDRLQFELHAEGDSRERNPRTPATSRIVRSDKLYRFLCERQIPVHQRFAEIAAALLAEQEPIQHIPPVARDVPQTATPADRHGEESLAVGLLMMYIRQLAQKREAPPQRLLKGGANKNLNVQALSDALYEFVEHRTDLKSGRAALTSGAAKETIRKWLGKGAAAFKDNLANATSASESVAALEESGR